MDTLNLRKQDGFSLIESLVSITILGILITISINLFNNIYKNPKMLLQGEALHLAIQQIDQTISSYNLKDTTYTNNIGNLNVRKLVKDTEIENLYLVEVCVYFKQSDKEILMLSTYLKR